MTYYLLPLNNNKFNINYLKFEGTNEIINIKPYLSKSLHTMLNKKKNEINKHCSSEWNKSKKYINTYEHIHTPLDNGNAIAKYKPLSRAYFKLVEIINNMKILSKFDFQNINSFHLAEGPGGFIEATVNLRKNKLDNYYGMTLNGNKEHIPGWRKSKKFLERNKNIYIEYGKMNNGDLLCPENYVGCFEKYKNQILHPQL